jgi:hypothetical protein
MKKNYSGSGISRILLVVSFLLTMTHYGNCQSDTANLSKILPRVVQDLRRCDLVKEENEVLKGYTASLKTMNEAAQNTISTLSADRDRWKGKAKGRGRGLLVAGGIVILETLRLVL